MRIGLFPLEIGRQVGGLEVYETNLIRALAQIDAENTYEIFCLDERVPEILGLEAANFRFHVLKASRFKGVLWDAGRAMSRAKLDAFHATFVPPPFTSIPYLWTHHGSEVMERPDFYPFGLGLRMRFLFRRAFKRARLILCVSNYVRDYLVRQRSIDPQRVRTVYNGCLPEFCRVTQQEAVETVREKHRLQDHYIIASGRIEPRKNPIRLLEAYDRFRRSVDYPPKLLFAGMKTWSGNEFDRTIARLELASLVIEIGHVAHEELPALYAGADFAIFPSLWEGFGLPALEAFAAGAPLIASNTTSLPEICGNSALLVDPYSVEAIADGIRRLHHDKNLCRALASSGLARAAEFSWKRSARETIAAYSSVASMLDKTR